MHFDGMLPRMFAIWSSLSATPASVIWCNVSVRRHVFLRSKDIIFDTFFVHVFSTPLQVSFSKRFSQLLEAFGAPFGIIKNGSENDSKRKRPSNMKTRSYEHVRGLSEKQPPVRTSQTRDHGSSTKCSNWLPLRFSKHCSKMLFGLASIANVPK